MWETSDKKTAFKFLYWLFQSKKFNFSMEINSFLFDLWRRNIYSENMYNLNKLYVFDNIIMQTIQHLYALHCRLNRKVNIAQIEQILTFEITSENFQNTRIVMSKIMQNLVALIEPSDNGKCKIISQITTSFRLIFGFYISNQSIRCRYQVQKSFLSKTKPNWENRIRVQWCSNCWAWTFWPFNVQKLMKLWE